MTYFFFSPKPLSYRADNGFAGPHALPRLDNNIKIALRKNHVQSRTEFHHSDTFAQSHLLRLFMIRPIHHAPAYGSHNLINQTSGVVPFDQDFIVLIEFRGFLAEGKVPLARKIPEKGSLSSHRRAIDVHIEKAQENADADTVRLQIRAFVYLGNRSNGSVCAGYDEPAVQRRHPFGIPEKEQEVCAQDHGRSDAGKNSFAP